MITVNTYNVAERSVYEGVALGVQKLMSDASKLENPDVVVDMLVSSIMSNLCDTFDFGVQPVHFSPQTMKKIWEAAKEESDGKGA